MYPATRCDCGRKFNSLRGTRIHKARWCEERNSPAGECKSIDGPMSQVYPYSIHKPIADHQRPGDIFCKPRIQWPKGNQIATWTNLDQQLSFYSPPILRAHWSTNKSFSGIIYDVCLECFWAVTHKWNKTNRKDNGYRKDFNTNSIHV